MGNCVFRVLLYRVKVLALSPKPFGLECYGLPIGSKVVPFWDYLIGS